MARELTFKINGAEHTASPEKIDRKKLYGWTEVLALDDDGDECKLVTMDSGGTTIIPKGGTGLGILSPTGEWVLRSDLKAVNPDGTPAAQVPSSYGITIDLTNKVTPEEYLDYSITAFYQLDTDAGMIEAVGNDIYAFEYSYRDSFEGSRAFVMVSGEGDDKKLFMLIGAANMFEMLPLSEMSIIEDDLEDEESGDDGDDMDFGF